MLRHGTLVSLMALAACAGAMPGTRASGKGVTGAGDGVSIYSSYQIEKHPDGRSILEARRANGDQVVVIDGSIQASDAFVATDVDAVAGRLEDGDSTFVEDGYRACIIPWAQEHKKEASYTSSAIFRVALDRDGVPTEVQTSGPFVRETSNTISEADKPFVTCIGRHLLKRKFPAPPANMDGAGSRISWNVAFRLGELPFERGKLLPPAPPAPRRADGSLREPPRLASVYVSMPHGEVVDGPRKGQAFDAEQGDLRVTVRIAAVEASDGEEMLYRGSLADKTLRASRYERGPSLQIALPRTAGGGARSSYESSFEGARPVPPSRLLEHCLARWARANHHASARIDMRMRVTRAGFIEHIDSESSGNDGGLRGCFTGAFERTRLVAEGAAGYPREQTTQVRLILEVSSNEASGPYH